MGARRRCTVATPKVDGSAVGQRCAYDPPRALADQASDLLEHDRAAYQPCDFPPAASALRIQSSGGIPRSPSSVG